MFRMLSCIGVIAVSVVAQNDGVPVQDSVVTMEIADSLSAAQQSNDTVSGVSTSASTAPAARMMQKSKPAEDSSGTNQQTINSSGQQSVKKIKLIKREYNYRRALGLAIGMMAFIAVMMASAQNWNPE